jgi:serine/threonine-protein kinase
MSPHPLTQRLRAQRGLDVDAALVAFRKATGSSDPDAFLIYLREKRLITDGLFRELHGTDQIAVAHLVSVKPDCTLVVERPTPTLMLPENMPTLVPPAEPANDVVASPSRSRYSLLGLLGKGAMGEVHVARDEDLLRKVAYKHMVPGMAGSRALAARFFSEIQVTAQLDHPNIVPIYGLEVTAEHALGYSMKLVQGQTLAHLLEEARTEVRTTGGRRERRQLTTRLEVFLKVCDAMAYAHSKGVLHRDLKPENVMVGRYHEVYVMDWGICRLMGSRDPQADKLEGEAAAAVSNPTDSTQYGAILGTPAYMSPEQAAGLNPELDGRSDLYALGVILHEVVSLRGAVTGRTLEETLARARRGERDPLVHIHPRGRIPRELGAIVDKATALRPEDRYNSVAALAEDVRRFLGHEAVRALPDNAVAAAARFLARHRVATLAAMVVLGAVGAGATIAVLAHEGRALARAKLHEERLQALTTAVVDQSHAIDSHFYRNAALLAGMAGRAAEIVGHPRPASAAPTYLDQDFEAGGHVPPDLAHSSFYGRAVSLASPVVKLAPGVDRATVEADIALAPALAPAMAQVVLATAGDDTALSLGDTFDHVRDEGAPLMRAFVSLASGVHFSYPGMGGFPPEYDGRKRPKYALAAHTGGIKWGNPYPDQFGHGLLLPMATSLHDEDGRFLGVAGADTSFQYISDRLLAIRGRDDVEATYLVDDQGRVVVQAARAADGRSKVGDLHHDLPIDLATLPYPEVVMAIRAGHGGVLADGPRVAAFYRLSALGWYYVVIARI